MQCYPRKKIIENCPLANINRKTVYTCKTDGIFVHYGESLAPHTYTHTHTHRVYNALQKNKVSTKNHNYLTHTSVVHYYNMLCRWHVILLQDSRTLSMNNEMKHNGWGCIPSRIYTMQYTCSMNNRGNYVHIYIRTCSHAHLVIKQLG